MERSPNDEEEGGLELTFYQEHQLSSFDGNAVDGEGSHSIVSSPLTVDSPSTSRRRTNNSSSTKKASYVAKTGNAPTIKQSTPPDYQCYDDIERGGNVKIPFDLDQLLESTDSFQDMEDASFLGGASGIGPEELGLTEQFTEHPKFFSNPERRLLDQDASLIPGSPFSKPANRKANRPTESLHLAKYASSGSFALTTLVVGGMLFFSVWNYTSFGRIAIEVVLSALSFLGLFWNSYYMVSSVCKCFIPKQAFTTNTKYCSIIPEHKLPEAAWLDVTIQIPVHRESLLEVLMPTLKSCMAAQTQYVAHTKNTARCNIVVCDDGIMSFLKDNFPAAEMLWETICATSGGVVKLRRLLKHIPHASRYHLKGLRSKDVHEVFYRMLFYYHYKIGFVARSTVDRRGKSKKASNLNSHLRLAFGAQQLAEKENELTFHQALLEECHNDDGSRSIMFGNDIELGDLICINEANARMAEAVISKTVPEFLNDTTLGFTQHATKTMPEQRSESYFTNFLAVHTDALYQGHFLLSSILGCHPPLVGHSIFLRSEALRQCGRMRTLRKAEEWLCNIGLPFLPVHQIGFGNLRAANRIEYWSENHVSEDFELMIHLYNLGFNGRYCAYPDCEFQGGINRTFDKEAGRHRKFALGAHELVFNPIQDFMIHGIFTPLFRTFLRSGIPSYYKIFLTASLCSYTSGCTYLIVYIAAALTRIFDHDGSLRSVELFSPAVVIVLYFFLCYILGYACFLISLLRMNVINDKLLFPEYRRKWCGGMYLIFVKLRYCLVFQFLFYSVTSFTFNCLGAMDHIFNASNKDTINISRCTAFYDTMRFNWGNWLLAGFLGLLSFTAVVQDFGYDYFSAFETLSPSSQAFDSNKLFQHALFAGPPMFLAAMAFIVPIILNPFILGWPFFRRPKQPEFGRGTNNDGTSGGDGKSQRQQQQPSTAGSLDKDSSVRDIVDINAFMNRDLGMAMERMKKMPDTEIGSLASIDLKGSASPGMSSLGSSRKVVSVQRVWERERWRLQAANEQIIQANGMYSIPQLVATSRDVAAGRHLSEF